jgi:hypothetical protein
MTAWDPDDKERTALHEGAVVTWSCGVVIGPIHLDTVKEGGRATTTTSILTSRRTHTPFEQIACYVPFRTRRVRGRFTAPLRPRAINHVDMSAVDALEQQNRREPVVEPGQLPGELHARRGASSPVGAI